MEALCELASHMINGAPWFVAAMFSYLVVVKIPVWRRPVPAIVAAAAALAR